jgi:hypothetical protein
MFVGGILMKVELKCNSRAGKESQLFLDGQDISNYCNRVIIETDVHKANKAIIHIIPTTIETTTGADVFVNFGGKKYKLVEEST